ncbi:RNA methyltransferase [Cylindrospermopsis raciborskii S07]|uniref:RNA methyltransferase n=1 Tax=Cylindrospermopsis raciborskii TaxID=77022 RepID=UPI000C9E82CE|nr:RNA methyltransferase [Cylindrospermopsis raciborskii]PNK01946.1 RNA methyltransferase [Cylindrospermopsis raciborskii S07]PNK06466.1 RNA methyltransferase [Cylindrospermopsis raciborskii S10]PNK12181.1 RNA methyltransferase [Cylindrospermopsis raciborskii S14]PNK14251.1 RNA methyltransferase [Cylindrospermopsis raciborskii S05]PNK16260.1 RNA methyltransferase [Cylindrospermopsis raciborskii S06]
METEKSALEKIKVILVEPAGCLNLGSIARVMKNFGLCDLILVNPQCDPTSLESLRMAVHAPEILENSRIVDNLTTALAGCDRAIATIGRDYNGELPIESPRHALPWLLAESEKPAGLIFGREDRGLTNQEINYAQKLVSIPTSPEYTSLNLATAVSICCYELSQSLMTMEPGKMPTRDIATLDVLESYYQELESLLLSIGYLYPHTASSRMEKFRHLYNRSELTTTEVAMLRGILKQVQWAIKNF